MGAFGPCYECKERRNHEHFTCELDAKSTAMQYLTLFYWFGLNIMLLVTSYFSHVLIISNVHVMIIEDCAKDGDEEFFTEMHCVRITNL